MEPDNDLARRRAQLSATKREALAKRLRGEVPARTLTAPESALEPGVVPLLPVQRRVLARIQNHPDQYNVVRLLSVKQRFDPAAVEQAVEHLILHHDALRLRFRQLETGWQQVLAPPDSTIPFIYLDVSALPAAEQEPALRAAIDTYQVSLNVVDGPVLRVVLFDRGPDQPQWLLFVIHHLVMDGFSLTILFEDFLTAYQQLSQAQPVQLPAKTTAFKHYAERVTAYGQSPAFRADLNYWQSLPWDEIVPVPIDDPGGHDSSCRTEGSLDQLVTLLSAAETAALLRQVDHQEDLQVLDLLVTALAQAVVGWTQQRLLLFEVANHGRAPIFPDIDLSRTVGWCTIFPYLVLDLRHARTPADVLAVTRAQLRRALTSGVGCELVRDAAVVGQSRLPQTVDVYLNYLGRQSVGLSPATGLEDVAEFTTLSTSAENVISQLIKCDAAIVDDRLALQWAYSTRVHRRATIAALSQACAEALRGLCAASATGSSDTTGRSESSTP